MSSLLRVVGWLVGERERERKVKQIRIDRAKPARNRVRIRECIDGTSTVEYNDLHTHFWISYYIVFSHGIHHSTRRCLVAVEAIARFQVHRPGTMPAARQSLFHTV